MKKFVFSLEKVLSYKKQTLDVKKSELFQLQHQLVMLEKAIEQLRDQYGQANACLVEKMKEGLLPADISLAKNYLNQTDKKIQALLLNRQQLLDIIAKKKQEVLIIRTDISGLERLKDKQVDAYRKALQKEQELAIEEFVSHASSASNVLVAGI